jgi:hypothetical protein
MPFTFSHPAAVIPLNYLPRRYISLTALVIGSMTPDFEYFIRMRMSATIGHTWPGLFWFDLPVGLVLFLIYQSLIRNKLIAHIPDVINRRFSPFQTRHKTVPLTWYLVVIIICLLVGATTHILWDSFTHPLGYFVNHHRILRRQVTVGPYKFYFYNMLQQVSTIVGALMIIYSIYKLPEKQSTNRTYKEITLYWFKISGVAMIVLMIRSMARPDTYRIGDVIVVSISGLLMPAYCLRL